MKQKQVLGRSIVEMLCIIAVIGVLSISALSGLQYVLDKIKANAIMDEALEQAVFLRGRKNLPVTTGGEIKYAYQSKYISSRKYEDATKKTMLLTVNNVKEGVCQRLVSNHSPTSVILSVSTDDGGACKSVGNVVLKVSISAVVAGN